MTRTAFITRVGAVLYDFDGLRYEEELTWSNRRCRELPQPR